MNVPSAAQDSAARDAGESQSSPWASRKLAAGARSSWRRPHFVEGAL